MAEDIEMKVLPSYIDGECTIVFSFRFLKGSIKIGEVIIQTCKPNSNAYCCKFSIAEEYKQSSMMKLMSFLKIIGVQELAFGSH
jgi:hypothetical protein